MYSIASSSSAHSGSPDMSDLFNLGNSKNVIEMDDEDLTNEDMSPKIDPIEDLRREGKLREILSQNTSN